MSTKLIIILAAVVIIMNLICFFLMRYDKQCARMRKRRVPENVLFLSAGLFGALGGVLAMNIYHHKTKHWNFKTFFPLMLIVQVVILGYMCLKWLVR